MSDIRPLALAYHGVTDVPLKHDPHALQVRPGDLRKQIARLRGWGYTLVTFSEIVERTSAGRGSGLASLTFDDGMANNLHELVEILEGTDAVATVFVATGWLGGTHPEPPFVPILTSSEVTQLAATGRVEIGSHTHSHPDLSELDHHATKQEFVRSKEILEDLTGTPITVAAYPFGKVGPQSASACKEAGFVAAARAGGTGSWSDPFDIPREDMSNRQTSAGFWLKKMGWYEPLATTIPGRALRRAVRMTKGVLG